MTEFCDNCAVHAAETGKDWSLERPAEDGHQVRTLCWEASPTRAPGAHTWPTAGMQVTTVASRVRLALWTRPSRRTLLDPGFAGLRSILPLQGGQVGSCSALLFSQGQRMMASPLFPPCMTGKPAPLQLWNTPSPLSLSPKPVEWGTKVPLHRAVSKNKAIPIKSPATRKCTGNVGQCVPSQPPTMETLRREHFCVYSLALGRLVARWLRRWRRNAHF